MCGILAIFARAGHPLLNPEKVRELSHRQRTRGPDATGVVSGETWALAHERLSIMDPQESANQPFSTKMKISLVPRLSRVLFFHTRLSMVKFTTGVISGSS